MVEDTDRLSPEKRAQKLTQPVKPKRFYEVVTVAAHPSGFAVLLDGRQTRTPARKLLAVADEAVAKALAAEWDAQQTEIDPAAMPLTRMVNTALDRVVEEMAAVRAEIVRHAGADMICYRAEGPDSLIEAENAAWTPLVDWAEHDLGARLNLAEGIIHVAQDDAAMAAIAAAVEPFDALGLTALHVATTLSGSAIIGLALARGRLSVAEAWAAAHIDEDWQTSQWGRDEAVVVRRAGRFAEMQAAALLLDRARA